MASCTAKTSRSAKSGDISWRQVLDEAWQRDIDGNVDRGGFDQGLAGRGRTVSEHLINAMGLSFCICARERTISFLGSTLSGLTCVQIHQTSALPMSPLSDLIRKC